MQKGLPQLAVYHLNDMLFFPVDQNIVRVSKDEGDLIFFINAPASTLSALFRPFIWVASNSHPPPHKSPDASSSSELRHFMQHTQIRRHTSLTPMSASKS